MPPELIHRRGSLKRMSCAAHIWCWPTSVVTMALAAGEAVDFGHQVLGLDFGIADGVCRRVLVLPGADLLPPGATGALRLRIGRGGILGSSLFNLDEHAFHVAHDGDVRSAVLADLGGVDIDVDDLGVRREGGKASGDAVVEAHAEGDQQVGVGHRHVGGVAAVHAGHAEMKLGSLAGRAPRPIRVLTAGASMSSANSRSSARGVGGDDAAAGVDQRPLGFRIIWAARRDLAGVAFGEDLVAGQVDGGDGRVVALRLKTVLGDIDQHGAGPCRWRRYRTPRG